MKSYKGFITFGSNQLPKFKGNPMEVMLIVEGKNFSEARETMAKDDALDIQYRFAFQYDINQAEEMIEKWDMKLYTTEELLKEYR